MKKCLSEVVNIINVKNLYCPKCDFNVQNNCMDFNLNRNEKEQAIRCPICDTTWTVKKDSVFIIAENEESAVRI